MDKTHVPIGLYGNMHDIKPRRMLGKQREQAP